VVLQPVAPRGRVAVVPARPVAAPATVAPAETLPLPRLDLGATLASVRAAFAPGVTPRRVAPSWRRDGEAWEWSEPAGRYAVVEFVNGALAVAQVRRPWSAGLPAVEAAALPALRTGEARAQVERAIGRGWPVVVTVGVAGGGDLETCAWAIRDRGVGTGAVLWVGFQDGRAVAIEHPWVER
jgi:hypothetical protein